MSNPFSAFYRELYLFILNLFLLEKYFTVNLTLLDESGNVVISISVGRSGCN